MSETFEIPGEFWGSLTYDEVNEVIFKGIANRGPVREKLDAALAGKPFPLSEDYKKSQFPAIVGSAIWLAR